MNVATPPTAATPLEACAPPSVPPLAVTDTVTVESVTRFPNASSTRTTGCADNTAPDTPATGCEATTNRDGEPWVTPTAALVLDISNEEPED